MTKLLTSTEAYFLGLLYSKGDILENGSKIRFRINIKFRRPNDEALRSDNIYTVVEHKEDGKEKVSSRFFDDLSQIGTMLSNDLKLQFNLINATTAGTSWDKKTMILLSNEVDNNDEYFCSLFNTNLINCNTLHSFPFDLHIEYSPKLSLAFVQGVCDACSLLPNEASSQNGGDGNPRIQLEPNQDRWELCIGLCKAFQIGLNIRVNNINWGHPEIRTHWKGQNHQFRVLLSDIPNSIELYRLNYKKEEYHNLYERKCEGFKPNHLLCPLKKKGVKENDVFYISESSDPDLNSDLLDDRLKGYSIDVPGKKSILVCYLLGCDKCKEFINVKIKKYE